MHELAVTPNAAIELDIPSSILPLKTKRLSYAIDGTQIIDAVDLQINAGGCTAIMGYNGAGKSVLLRLLHGLLNPSAGSISWTTQISDKAIANRQTMVFQTPVLLKRTVANNIVFVLRQRGLKGEALQRRLDLSLSEADLSNLKNKHALSLSGGERQRVALARALALEPEILFLDEPTSSLDPAATEAIELLLSKAMRRGTKLILVSQSAGQVRRLANDVIFLHTGRITEHTPTEAFMQAPQSTPAQNFLAGRLHSNNH